MRKINQDHFLVYLYAVHNYGFVVSIYPLTLRAQNGTMFFLTGVCNSYAVASNNSYMSNESLD